MQGWESERRVRLEYHSQQFAKKLFKVYPEWKSYAAFYEKIEDNFPVHYLDVNIPSANPRVTRPLRIYTGPAQDVTIIWTGDWHMHFAPRPGNREPDYTTRALEAINSLVSDRLVICAMYQNGTISVTWGGEAGSDLLKSVASQRGVRLEMRSWLGTHDRVTDL